MAPTIGGHGAHLPLRLCIVVAGVPGAGKTTLLRRAVDRDAARVVDTDDRARRGPLLYPGHYARIAAAIAGGRPAVIHSRGTHPIARRTIALLARLRGRPRTSSCSTPTARPPRPASAPAAARSRSDEMDRQVARWQELLAAGGPTGEGWESVTLLDREQAAEVAAMRFVTAPALTPLPA